MEHVLGLQADTNCRYAKRSMPGSGPGSCKDRYRNARSPWDAYALPGSWQIPARFSHFPPDTPAGGVSASSKLRTQWGPAEMTAQRQMACVGRPRGDIRLFSSKCWRTCDHRDAGAFVLPFTRTTLNALNLGTDARNLSPRRASPARARGLLHEARIYVDLGQDVSCRAVEEITPVDGSWWRHVWPNVSFGFRPGDPPPITQAAIGGQATPCLNDAGVTIAGTPASSSILAASRLTRQRPPVPARSTSATARPCSV